MHRATKSSQNESSIGAARGQPELLEREIPPVVFSPATIVRHQTAHWRGAQARTVQIVRHNQFEYSYDQRYHLLVAVEQGARYDGETFVEGLPTSTMRNYSQKLVFVPAGRKFFGVQNPRLLTRSLCLYIDPRRVLVDPDLRFPEADLEPGLLFENCALWQTALKLKPLIGSTDWNDRMYADALCGVLAHELLRLHGRKPLPRSVDRGGLAAWQRKRIAEFIEEHLADDTSLDVLADLVRLSPYHFLRSFKKSFSDPPYRYWTRQRVIRAKGLLANQHIPVAEIAFAVGFATPSAFSAAFRRITGQTPTDYRRGLQ
jgi:AraC family transcriptional regulator